ncbi:MAG: hypothetical protein RJA70_3420 [Pseudomonadota bacterium]|jgi:hypothetical protein
MQINNLSYQNKGSVRINEGAWIDLNHDTVEMHTTVFHLPAAHDAPRSALFESRVQR